MTKLQALNGGADRQAKASAGLGAGENVDGFVVVGVVGPELFVGGLACLQVGEDGLGLVEGAAGPKPLLVRARSFGSEVTAAFHLASQALARAPRVAIAIVDPDEAVEFFRSADIMADTRGSSVATIRTREDLGNLSYSARGLVVGTAEDLAGLQFPEFIIAGLGAPEEFEGKEHRRLQFMSRLYVAVSRASTQVTIVVDDDQAGTPTVIKSAVAAAIVAEQPNR